MKLTEFENIIAFCILMEGNGGIMEKSPDYVMEKYGSRGAGLLDEPNFQEYSAYLNRWEGLLPDQDKTDGH